MHDGNKKQLLTTKIRIIKYKISIIALATTTTLLQPREDFPPSATTKPPSVMLAASYYSTKDICLTDVIITITQKTIIIDNIIRRENASSKRPKERNRVK